MTFRKEPISGSKRLVSYYLVCYNLVSATLWFCLLLRTLFAAYFTGVQHVFADVSGYSKCVQTGALLEVLHIIFGLVRSPLFTTVIQISSRLLLVWGISHTFPQICEDSPAYTLMLAAWSIAEVIRYSFYAFNLRQNFPQFLIKLRYNAFYSLYPLGAGSEMWLIFKSLDAADFSYPAFGYALRAILLIYVPGFHMMYTHMISQRKKVYISLGKRKA
ncbi:putative very-long-chain (3R)-3-hydroxyacyl-CoA dehydratase [Neolecta irregularis DAH-3]|uniref:Very-long-chain (3R)-3-hydroxyacyl-CoA dehydratase n=1 Tax=Neolecta irregularis (strain DAH-3) TaxID=1198029 RepID=A0A1U7LPM2_NEOID|nr:putative very-long-chain (3R)-3-hydroxyacyl-CoA dehydratase [Neolecta irregularis DAH-3]|eukprot:OLL24471.1 putative very-long-chain (3R)-3-hydroxyacyl-CoA dehydratase [Neolecta irregularis DAH-3]